MTDEETVRRRLARLTRPVDAGPAEARPADRDVAPDTDAESSRADESDRADELDFVSGSRQGFRTAAFDPGRRGVKALAVVAVVVTVVVAILVWRSRPQVEPVRPVDGAAVVGATAGPASGVPADSPAIVDPAAEATAADASTEVVVAVTGRVRRPGLVRLPVGARVADAVHAAGGALPGTDLAWLNLARKVTDGELIAVGVTPPPGVAAGPGAVAGAAPASGGGAKVDLNAATTEQLQTLPGIGPVLAQRIVDHRDRVGGFDSVADLREVSGIGDTRFDQLRELVTV
ncbi:ComEA family DNA-binding protein [Solwaraspora sp. WMMD406]|uniref:ComEA family DNA-binding protein n=1 Tax=Solwaraspora sp. WMMD406 TaxID=3016095 RepID=UPI0024164EB9|nr:ComEA family DNA-binding protein [Solwaraspora sp. WMMD406]MDG4764825.1 ComEA family DNA-binding protein [Solwaraspora sp. WMMD406]